jgi:hypothetical protein
LGRQEARGGRLADVADRQAIIGTTHPTGSHASRELTLAFATVFPPVLVGVTAGARLIVPTALCQHLSLATLACVGILSYIAGSWILVRRFRHARRLWLIAVILYDLAMPLLLFGVALLADASIACR